MDFIRVSHVAIQEVPVEHRHLLHKSYEDNDLEGADQAEELLDFLVKEVPESFVGVLANDSVSPPCAYIEGHYHCDYYAPYWFTILISTAVWEQYKEAVLKKDQEHKNNYQCRVLSE
jgi:hypothetical protein